MLFYSMNGSLRDCQTDVKFGKCFFMHLFEFYFSGVAAFEKESEKIYVVRQLPGVVFLRQTWFFIRR